MIQIKAYKNGYEIVGHAQEKICHQVSLWHWIGSNLILGLDKDAREYTSDRDNLKNPNEGLSWVVCNPQNGNLEWVLGDFIVSAERWGEYYWENQVSIKKIDDFLQK